MYRWFFVVFFLFPISLVYDIFLFVCSVFAYFLYPNKPNEHAMRVEKIRAEIREWVADGCPNKLCTARPGWQAMSLRAGKYKSTYRNIHVDLYDILEVNETKQTVRVEPMCNMGKLTHALLPKGWTIPVVPELDDLTVGGLVAGVGIETSSHKYGLFQHICVSFEVVLADGR
jgi:delta24-sterol reductase